MNEAAFPTIYKSSKTHCQSRFYHLKKKKQQTKQTNTKKTKQTNKKTPNEQLWGSDDVQRLSVGNVLDNLYCELFRKYTSRK